MFPEWTWVVGLWIGAAIGSFLNVVIYRMPLNIALSDPKHSYCPSCKTRLRALDLVPLLSWLLLRGKCRHCRAPVAPRYFIVELITGSLWAIFWYQHLIAGSDPYRAVAYSLFASALVAAIFIDLRYYIIPDEVNVAMLCTGFALNAALYIWVPEQATTWGIPSSIAGALAGVGVLWGVAFLGRLLFKKDAMGHGDIKMARGIGAVLFPSLALISFGLAVGLGAVLGVVQVLLRRKESGNDVNETLEEEYPPESLGSLLKSGLGYVLCIDAIGLFVPKLYENWFGEHPYAVEEVDETFDVAETMIPFGPYLAVGALCAAIFSESLLGWVVTYWNNATGVGP